MGSLEHKEKSRVGQPEQQPGQQAEISDPVGWNRTGQSHGHRDHLSSPTISSVVSATATPALRKASSLLFAVPRLPEMIAPA